MQQTDFIQPVEPVSPHARSLAEQAADFTAEGAPPPGKKVKPRRMKNPKFLEGEDDPAEAEELERQHSA